MQQRQKRRRTGTKTRSRTPQRRRSAASNRRPSSGRTQPDFEELRTEEQRRRASARRRAKRRREQHRQMMIRLGAIAAVVAVLVTLVMGKRHKSKPLNWEDQSIIAVKGEEEQQGQTMEQTIQQNPDDYPESLLALLERNPETLQFVYDYPTQHKLSHDIDLFSQVTEGGIPLFLQWDERWGYETYGSDMMAITGCGPTCLSMVVCGMESSAEWTPLKVARYADEHGYYVEGSGTAWKLMTDGATELGLKPQQVELSEKAIRSQLKEGHPIISSMGPGEFTDQGHYIVLVGINPNGTIQIRDPNSRIRSEREWKLKDLTKQMKTLWVYT